MISSASHTQPYQSVTGTSSPAHIPTSSATSVHSAQSTPANTDRLEEGVNGFRNAWSRQLEQESRVQGTGAVTEQRRVEASQETSRSQTVADMLAQERNRRV